MSIAENSLQLKKDFDDVYEAGKEAENKRYWEKFWENAKATSETGYIFRGLFAGPGWNKETFSKIIYPDDLKLVSVASYAFYYFNHGVNKKLIDMSAFCNKVDFSPIEDASYLFHNARVENVTVDLSNATNITYAFGAGNGGDIKNLTLKLTSKCKTLTKAFAYMNNIVSLIFTEDSEIVKSVSFAQSSKLSAESIQSIINALGTVTTTQKITFHADVVSKLTDEQADTILAKGWNVG